MTYTLPSRSPAINQRDFKDAPTGEEESLLSRTFQRGFDAGQSLSNHRFIALLPWLLEEFSTANPDPAARQTAAEFVEFARRRAARLAVDVAYVAEGAGI